MTDGQHDRTSGEGEIRAGIAAAAPYQQPKDAEEKEDWPFRLTAKGVEKRVDHKDKETGAVTSEWRWFCSHLEVIAQSRTVEGEDWGRLLVISDGDRRVKTWAMPMSMLAGDGSEYRARLLSLGLIMAPGPGARDYLHNYISMARPKEKVRCVNRIGWHGAAFVLPDCTIGETSGERVVLQTGAKPDHPFQVQGSLQDWQNAVARPAVGNSRLVFALCAAFAAPLLYLIGAESGGFHFRGASSTGKSTALTIAGSVWGGGSKGQIKGYIQQWRATDNGLEGTAAAHCDALSAFDELSQISPQAAGATAYMLANGMGKVRAGRSGETRPVAEWRCLFLSTGEIGLGDKIAEDGHGRRIAAGQEVRVIDIPADAGAGLGLFEHLHDQPSAEVFARHMKEATGRCYGTAARAFLEKIVIRLDEVKAVVIADRDSFVAKVCPAGADGQIQRVAGRFGLLTAAGRLATALGIVPWGQDEAFKAVRQCFDDWLAKRDGLEPAEDREALAAVRRFIEQHGSSRFEVIRLDSSGHEVTSDRVRERAGFRREIDGVVHYYVMPEAWKLDVCQGIDPKRAAQVLSAAGLLITDRGRLQDKCRLPVGPRPVWCYHLTGAVLAGGDDQGHD